MWKEITQEEDEDPGKHWLANITKSDSRWRALATVSIWSVVAVDEVVEQVEGNSTKRPLH